MLARAYPPSGYRSPPSVAQRRHWRSKNVASQTDFGPPRGIGDRPKRTAPLTPSNQIEIGVGRSLREILPYSHGDAQKHSHESVNNSDAQKPSIDIRHIPAFPFTNRDSAEFNLARCSPLNVSLPRSISSLAAVSRAPSGS